MKIFKPLKVEHKTLEEVNVPETIIWLEPKTVCEIAYQNVTDDGRLRIPRFLRIRFDKSPSECTLEQILKSNLHSYASKRDFNLTPEPSGSVATATEGQLFVVQEHHARSLHFDLRLERNGVLKSWAVPKGIPEKPDEKRLAMQTEDHPLQYRNFEGTIPEGEYGAGTVKIFDSGTYGVKIWKDDIIEFTFHGKKLNGQYVLTRFKKAADKAWLLLKIREMR